MGKSKSEYTVVARRYRPRQFDELVGQEAVAQALRNALTSDRVAHAYLFTGARGVGKTSCARILAKALNCQKGPTPTPCDLCTSCVAIAEGDDVDVREIDGASNNGVEDVRAIRQDVSTRPTRSRYKIYIIDEVHMLSQSAFNALLKTLEEPPPHVKFIFATTTVQKVPITVLSRCQRFDFGTISADRIAEQLRQIVKAEKMTAEDDALEIIARRAGGSMRDAQSLLDQLLAFGGEGLTAELVQKLLGVAGPERIMGLTEAIARREPQLALERLAAFADDGLELGEVLDQLIDHWRDLMLVCCTGQAATHLNTPSRHREALHQQASTTNLDTVLAGLDILIATKGRLRNTGYSHTLVQMALIRLCRLEDLAQLSQIAYWVGHSGSAPASAVAARANPTAALNAAARPGLTLPPEAKKKQVPDDASAAITPESLPAIWAEILAQVGMMLGAQLQKAGLPAISGPTSLVLSFDPEYNSAYEHCGGAANLQRLESALRTRTGQAWTVRLERKAAANGTNGHPAGNGLPAPVARVRPQEAMQQFPVLQRALDLLEALPVFLDQGFGVAPAPTPVAPPTATPIEDEET